MDITTLVYIDSTGYHFADYPTFLAWLTSVYTGIYGADAYLGADSQDGQFLAILAQAFYDTASLGSAIYNSFSPVSAQGAGLARIVKINGLEKEIATNSTVELQIVGASGTIISNGAATDILQQTWLLPASVTIPMSGTITVTATAQLAGALAAAANTVTNIFTPTLGWQSVNNSAQATVGAPVESDAALRQRQITSTSIPAQTVYDATLGAIENLAGVTAVRGYENVLDSTDGNGLPPHSICVVVTGGDDVAICQEIIDYKTPGTNTYGNTSELVYDAKGMPLNISFQRSVVATIGVQVTITTNAAWSSDYVSLIQTAVAAVINAGLIGNNVLYTTLFAPAYLNGAVQGQSYIIDSIELNKNGGSYAAGNVSLDFDEQAVCVAGTNVSVIIT